MRIEEGKFHFRWRLRCPYRTKDKHDQLGRLLQLREQQANWQCSSIKADSIRAFTYFKATAEMVSLILLLILDAGSH